ncbi:hypothetical protein [uncultured Methanobrevibacter sp.]|uniref:hypothetical protein n=1 Tax=uncultured Methanobrevibacter sp. TaxID=253161 RepID=UPI0025D5515C|nr:hypothetical protein [uncultured Methanobrevibacter sp.]
MNKLSALLILRFSLEGLISSLTGISSVAWTVLISNIDNMLRMKTNFHFLCPILPPPNL